MVDLPTQAPSGASQPYQIDLPLAGLSPGEYVIEIRAKGVSGEATELVAIKVRELNRWDSAQEPERLVLVGVHPDLQHLASRDSGDVDDP